MLSWPLCDLTSLCCSVPFLKPSEWVPFSTRLKSSVNSLLWQISISLNLFPGVDAALKLLSESIQFPSVFFKKYSVYLCVCVFRMLVSEAPVSLFEQISPLAWVTQSLCMTPGSLQHTWWGFFPRELCSDVPQFPLHPQENCGAFLEIQAWLDSGFLPGLTLVAVVRGSEWPEGRKRGLASWGLVGCEGCEGLAELCAPWRGGEETSAAS